MANLEDLDKVLALSKGSTWGTAVNATVPYDGMFSWTGTQEQSRGVGVNQKYLTHIRRTNFSVEATFEGMYTFDGAINHLLFGMIRPTSSTPSEQNVGEGDYLHTWALGHPSSIPFYTIAWMENSTTALEIPSFQVQSITINAPINQPMTYSVTGVGDRIVQGGENTYAELETVGGSPLAYDMAIFGCGGTPANHFFRLDDDTSGLASGDDMPVNNVSFTLSRAETAQRTTRGANSPYILQPRETGRVTGQLSFTLNVEDVSAIDFMADFIASTTETAKNYQAKFLVDGPQIGSGDNKTFEAQFPYLCYSTERPTGFNRNEDQISNPVVTFEIMGDPSYSPKTGQNDDVPMSLLLTNTRSTSY